MAICRVSLTLPRVKHGAGLLRRTRRERFKTVPYKEIACLGEVPPLRGEDRGIFEQSEEDDFFTKLLVCL